MINKTEGGAWYKHPYNSLPHEGEINEDPSETVQGESQTIEQMLVRYNNGEALPVDKKQVWEDSEVPIPQIQDLTDADEAKRFIDSTMQKLAKAKEDIKQQEKQAQKEAKQALEAKKKLEADTE